MRTRFFNLLSALILASGFIFTQTLFISEAAEGSSNNKYLEIFNAGDSEVDLSAYSLSSCSNGCDTDGEWDYPDNVTFEAGTTLAAGDVYVVCHGSASDEIQAECDQTFTYLSNGDDLFALTAVGGGTAIDQIGAMGGDPGSGWKCVAFLTQLKIIHWLENLQ
jgi:predicted extracellular nuclease